MGPVEGCIPMKTGRVPHASLDEHRPPVRRLGRRLLYILFALGGCAGVVRTEGTSGPIAWRVTDLATVTRNVQGQPVDTYDFTLVIRNTSDRAITLSKMNRTVYQAGGGQPGYSSGTGRWVLRPGGEWKFPLYSYTYCSASQGCLDRGGAQPLWQIVFTGTDDQNRSIEARLEIALPPQPMKHVDLGVTRKVSPSPEPPLVSGTTAAPRPIQERAAAPAIAREAPTNLVVALPTLRPGYEWGYRWEGPTGKGTFVWSVNRIDVIDGTEYYVATASEGREIYWRKHDRASWTRSLAE